MKSFWLAVPSLFCLLACSAETPTLPPTLEPLQITITPALAPLGIALQACATSQANTSLEVDTIPASQMGNATSDLGFHLGTIDPLPAFTVPIAGEQLQVVLHPALESNQLDESDLSQLFSGQVRNWTALGGDDLDVEVWLPMPGADQRVLFENQLLSGSTTSPLARLAPNPQAMMDAVAQTPGSIGFLPGAWDPANLPTIKLSHITPVLAFAAQEPTGAARQLLVCLQSQAGQQILSQDYLPLSDLDP